MSIHRRDDRRPFQRTRRRATRFPSFWRRRSSSWALLWPPLPSVRTPDSHRCAISIWPCAAVSFVSNATVLLSVWWHRAHKTPAYTQALDCSAHPQTSQLSFTPPPTNQTHSHTHTHSANIITLGQGCAIGWMSSAVMTLKSAGSPLADGPASTAQISWIASTSSIGAGLGAILFGLVCGRLGSRNATWLCAVPLTVSVE